MIVKKAFKKSRVVDTFIIELEDIQTKTVQKMEITGSYSLMRMRAFQLMAPGMFIKDVYRKPKNV